MLTKISLSSSIASNRMTRIAGTAMGGIAATSILLGSLEVAQAAVLVGPLNNLQGIDGLVVGDTVYDIRFRPGSFNSIFDVPAGAKPLPTFLNNASGASAAVNAINAFFNSVNFGDNAGPPKDGILGNVSNQYLIPYLADNSNNGQVTSKFGFYPETGGGNWTLGNGTTTDFTDQRNASQTPSYAEFTNGRSIPTPALLPGLVGMGAAAMRKRKQRKESIA